jgi:hypothetical protein
VPLCSKCLTVLSNRLFGSNFVLNQRLLPKLLTPHQSPPSLFDCQARLSRAFIDLAHPLNPRPSTHRGMNLDTKIAGSSYHVMFRDSVRSRVYFETFTILCVPSLSCNLPYGNPRNTPESSSSSCSEFSRREFPPMDGSNHLLPDRCCRSHQRLYQDLSLYLLSHS